MVMEAMRLSLLEHEQQQQRQREEEERNRRNGGTSERGRSTEPGTSTTLDTPSGQRSASVVPPQPVGERVDHRPSSSLPNNNPLDGLHTDEDWRRNPSQFSTLAAAIGAANTVSAILSAEGREPTPPPLASSSTRTIEAYGDTATISSDSSGTGQSSPLPTPMVDGDEGDVDYATLPSSPESPDHFPAGTGDGGTASSPRQGTPG